MRVLIVSTNDVKGGAARAAYRLHRSLISAGLESFMLVQFKWSEDPTVIQLDYSKRKWVSRARRFSEKVLSFVLFNNKKFMFSLSWLNNSNAVETINSFKADIVHLHWFNSGLLSISDLTRINGNIVWTLHDMWAFTSGKHVDSRFDIRFIADKKWYRFSLVERLVMIHKKFIFNRLKSLTIVGVSRWINDSAERSNLLSNFKHINLPNPIDTNFFKSLDRIQCRSKLGFEESEIVILFGAMNAETDFNKGFDLFVMALNLLPVSYTVVLYGVNKNSIKIPVSQRVKLFDTINNDENLIELYSVADVMVVPSRCENLSNTIMEAMACSTPVVAFDVGGNSDLIIHRLNGYLAAPEDPIDLASGIRWIVDTENGSLVKNAAREFVMQNFSAEVVANKYYDLYRSL
jgi:glycosyltransferase involved in cell wall biosynthesis